MNFNGKKIEEKSLLKINLLRLFELRNIALIKSMSVII